MRIQLNLREALFPITRTVPGNKDRNSPTRRRGSPHHNESGVPRTLHLKRSHSATNRDEPTEVSQEELCKIREEQPHEKLVRRLNARSRKDAPPMETTHHNLGGSITTTLEEL